MRINCPCCGERSLDEFIYHGDATVRRPDFQSPTAMEDFVAYVYERKNIPGVHEELWYHSAGCHSWLMVTREITTHAITSIKLAKNVALSRNLARRDKA